MKILHTPIFILVALIFCNCAAPNKFSNMLIAKKTLVDLNGDTEIRSIYFRANNNLRKIAKDKIELTAHINYGDLKPMKPVELDDTGKKKKFPKDKIFSGYFLSKLQLTDLITTYGNDGKVQYFIIEPYDKEKENYVYYKLVPADKDKRSLEKSLNLRPYPMDPSPPAPAP